MVGHATDQCGRRGGNGVRAMWSERIRSAPPASPPANGLAPDDTTPAAQTAHVTSWSCPTENRRYATAPAPAHDRTTDQLPRNRLSVGRPHRGVPRPTRITADASSPKASIAGRVPDELHAWHWTLDGGWVGVNQLHPLRQGRSSPDRPRPSVRVRRGPGAHEADRVRSL